MSKKNKDTKAPLTEQQSNARVARIRKFKRGAYATVITCVFVAVVIVFNIVATVLAERFPLSLDLTASGDFTISEENADYVKGISREDLEIEIVVCADEKAYEAGGIYTEYYDVSGGQFFQQNIYLLKEYTRLNKAISLTFIDPADPTFSAYKAANPDEEFIDGDILIQASFTMDGETVERSRHLTAEDVFEVGYDENDQISQYYYQYGTFSLAANNIETAVTSALASLTSDKVYKVALLTHNGGNPITSLETLMKQNNYEFTEVKNLNEEEIPEDADIAIISCPMYDYTEAELDIIDKYLDNDGKFGKTIFYIADARQPDLPNLNEFLSEWGFSVMSGNYVYETDAENRANYFMKPTEKTNDYTGKLSENDNVFYSMYDVAIQLKDPNGTRENQTLIEFSETAAALPTDAESVDEAVAEGPFVNLGLCTITPAVIDDPTNVNHSYVVVCSSLQFLDLGALSAKVGNLYAIMNTFDSIVGKTSTGVSFDSRSFTSNMFETLPTDASVTVMTVIFVGILPIALLVCGIVIGVRRRRS